VKEALRGAEKVLRCATKAGDLRSRERGDRGRERKLLEDCEGSKFTRTFIGLVLRW
jgi:hypothetical protein